MFTYNGHLQRTKNCLPWSSFSPISESLSSLFCKAAIFLSSIFFYNVRGYFSALSHLWKKQLSHETVSSSHSHLGHWLAAPLSHPLGDRDDALHSFVQCLLDVFQGRHHGNVRNGQSDACPEDRGVVLLHLRCTAPVWINTKQGRIIIILNSKQDLLYF